MNNGKEKPWSPPLDDDLTWFCAAGRLPSHPRPLDFTFEIDAFTFGVSRALESLYFPFYELRTRLMDGQLYFASIPSAFAERDIDAQMQRMRDSGLRFTRNIRRTWERPIRGEVEEYNDRLAAFAGSAAPDSDLAQELRALKRTRANQWFAGTRAVFAPAELLKHGVGETPPEEAEAVVAEALGLIQEQGAVALERALLHVGERLVESGAIDVPANVYWLDYDAVRRTLGTVTSQQDAVQAAKALAARSPGLSGPDTVGFALPSDAPRMYLIREILAVIA